MVNMSKHYSAYSTNSVQTDFPSSEALDNDGNCHLTQMLSGASVIQIGAGQTHCTHARIHSPTIACSCLRIVGVNKIGHKSVFTDAGACTFGTCMTSAIFHSENDLAEHQH